MRILGFAVATTALLSACGETAPSPGPAENGQAPAPRQAAPSAAADGGEPAPSWDLQSSGEGVALALVDGPESTVLRLFCPAGGKKLLVNVPGFRPIGSEERLSVGGGGDAVALVADSRGDRQRGGVSAEGEVPAELAALIGGGVSATYGAQRSGPHPAPPAALARAFVAACGEREARPSPAEPPSGPCRTQDGKALAVGPLRALGTEPFWNARIEGRCVTYSHPDDQKGTRIWTRFTPAPGGGTWSGSLDGRRFELKIGPGAGCSDGMSDRRYPLEAELLVGGEKRSGCAAPL